MNRFPSVDDVDKHTLTDKSYDIIVTDGQFWPTLGVKYGYDRVDFEGPSRIEVNRFRAYNAAVHPIASGIVSVVWLGILLAVLIYICHIFSLWKHLKLSSVYGIEAASAKLTEAGHSFSMAIRSVAINAYAQVSEQMPSDPVTWMWGQGAQWLLWCQTLGSTLMTWFADEDGPSPAPTPPTPPAAADVAPATVSAEHREILSLASYHRTVESYSDRAVALASTQDEDLLHCARRIANSAALIAEYVAARTVYSGHASYYHHYHHHFHPVSADSSITEEEHYARQELGAQPTAPTAVPSAAAAPLASGVDLGSMYGSEEAESRNRSRITYYFLRA